MGCVSTHLQLVGAEAAERGRGEDVIDACLERLDALLDAVDQQVSRHELQVLLDLVHRHRLLRPAQLQLVPASISPVSRRARRQAHTGSAVAYQ